MRWTLSNLYEYVLLTLSNFTPSRPLLTGRCRCTCLVADLRQAEELTARGGGTHGARFIARQKVWKSWHVLVSCSDVFTGMGENRFTWHRFATIIYYLDFLGNPDTAQYIIERMPDLTHTQICIYIYIYVYKYIYIYVYTCSKYAVSDSFSWIFLIIMNYLAVSWTS